jgi:hypothetical protein
MRPLTDRIGESGHRRKMLSSVAATPIRQTELKSEPLSESVCDSQQDLPALRHEVEAP